MIIVKACFDESGKSGDTDYVVFAGCVATDSEWQVISERWRAILGSKGLSYLTMKDAMHLHNEFSGWGHRIAERDEILLALANLIQPLIGFITSAPMESSSFATLSQGQKAKLKNLQYTGFEACVRKTLEQMKNPEMLLHVYCDDSDEYSEECLRLYRKLLRDQSIRRKCIAVTFADDKYFPPLQAADMIAYCERQNHSRDSHKPEPIIDKILEILNQLGSESGSLLYKSNGPGLGSGVLE